jgi:hypothetical protein
VTDGFGNWQAFAPGGTYYVQFYGPGITTTLRPVSVSCVPSSLVTLCGATLAGNNTWTGLNIFTALATFSNTVSTTTVQPSSAGSFGMGTCALPYIAAVVGTGANSATQLESNATACRTATFPDASGTVPFLSLIQTWPATQNFSSITTSSNAVFGTYTALTEGAPSTSVAGYDICQGNSTLHSIQCSLNGGGQQTVQFACGGSPIYAFVSGSDFTTTQTTYVTPFISWPMPTVACNVPFTCHIAYSQQTAAAAGDNFGVGYGAAGTAPTNMEVEGSVWVDVGVGKSPTVGALNLATTTSTSVISGGFTPANINVVYNAEISGFIEQPNGVATTMGIYIVTSSGADQMTVKRDSFCRIN